MKRVILILGFCLALLVSCQKEEETIIQDTTQSFLKSDPLAQLLSRASQNSTASDNILDNTSCFSVQLPVTVIVNSQQIIVTNQSDYQIVQDAIDEFSTDDDIVNFIFPITIKFKNHQTLIVQNSNQLDDVLDDCDEDDEFDESELIVTIKEEPSDLKSHAESDFEFEIGVEEEESIVPINQNSASRVERMTSDGEDLAAGLVAEYGEYDPTKDLEGYILPPIELMKDYGTGGVSINKEEIESNKDRIVQTLSHYKIDIAKIKAKLCITENVVSIKIVNK
jgi:hypothetical protein